MNYIELSQLIPSLKVQTKQISLTLARQGGGVIFSDGHHRKPPFVAHLMPLTDLLTLSAPSSLSLSSSERQFRLYDYFPCHHADRGTRRLEMGRHTGNWDSYIHAAILEFPIILQRNREMDLKADPRLREIFAWLLLSKTGPPFSPSL